MLIKRNNCLVCNKEFLSKREKESCSSACSTKLNYIRRTGNEPIKYKVCLKCEKSKEDQNFWGGGKGRLKWAWCKSCFVEFKMPLYKKEILKKEWTLLKEVEEFLKYLKDKNLYIDMVDALKLTYIHTSLFDKDVSLYKGSTNDEELFNIMLYMMVEWRNKMREKIIKNL